MGKLKISGKGILWHYFSRSLGAPQVRQTIAHGFSRGKRMQTSQAPNGAKEIFLSLLPELWRFV